MVHPGRKGKTYRDDDVGELIRARFLLAAVLFGCTPIGRGVFDEPNAWRDALQIGAEFARRKDGPNEHRLDPHSVQWFRFPKAVAVVGAI